MLKKPIVYCEKEFPFQKGTLDMKTRAMKQYLTVCIALLLLILCTACSSEKTKDELLEQPLTTYGSDRTVGDAVNTLFENPSWGTGDGSTNSNGMKKQVLSGTDKNGDYWVVDFYCNPKDPEDWYASVKTFETDGYYSSFLDEYGSDLVMRYFATGDTAYRYAFTDIYSCGNKVQKSYDLIEAYEGIGVTPSESAKAFINKYDELFPSAVDPYDILYSYLPAELVDFDVSLDNIKRNISRYGEKLFAFKGMTITDISETTVEDGEYLTEVVAYDSDFHYYDIVYCGELPEINVGDTVSGLALPVGEGLLDNMIGGQTEHTFLLSCCVIRGNNLSDIKDCIASPEVRYAAALDYAEMVAAQDVLGQDTLPVEFDSDMTGADNDILGDQPNQDEMIEEPIEEIPETNGEYSEAWHLGFDQGYMDGMSEIEYNDDPTGITDESGESDYMAGYEAGYITANYNR